MEHQAANGVPGGPAPIRRRRAGRVALAAAMSAVAAFLGLLTYGLLTTAPSQTIDEALARGKTVEPTAFSLPVLQPGDPGPLSSALEPALADRQLGLREVRGRPVVVNFWASWCVPCREEAPLLERAWLEHRGRGVVFVGLNQQDIAGDARRFLREFGISYLNVRDKGNGVAQDWGATGLPETFFLTADGRVAAHVVGAVSAVELRQGIAAALSGRAGRVDSDGAGPALRLEPME